MSLADLDTERLSHLVRACVRLARCAIREGYRERRRATRGTKPGRNRRKGRR